MLITRRHFVAGTLALGGSLLASTALPRIFVQPALAQSPSPAELAEPGPLGEQALGAENAPVTIIEYASMTCGACAEFHNKTYPTLKSKYIDTGKVRYILREFPLDPTAAGAFMLARCAGKDKYFPLVEAFFSQQNTWAVRQPIAPMLAIAKAGGFYRRHLQCMPRESAGARRHRMGPSACSKEVRRDRDSDLFH